jgi:SlyX protein
MDKEIVELQTRLAFQENAILELSDVLARQQGEIAALTAALDSVQMQVREALQMESQTPAEESPPPHY